MLSDNSVVMELRSYRSQFSLLAVLDHRLLSPYPDHLFPYLSKLQTVLFNMHHGYCPPDLPTFDELCNIAVFADDELFGRAMRLSNHVLHALIPPQSSASQRPNLRHRIHSLQLSSHTTRFSDSNFITRMLYKDNY